MGNSETPCDPASRVVRGQKNGPRPFPLGEGQAGGLPPTDPEAPGKPLAPGQLFERQRLHKKAPPLEVAGELRGVLEPGPVSARLGLRFP